MLAIVECAKQWHYYIKGNSNTVKILTNHANLQAFLTIKMLSRCHIRWAEFLSVFNIQIEHRPGKNNPTDAPSHHPDYTINPEEYAAESLMEKLQAKIWDSLSINELKLVKIGMLVQNQELKVDLIVNINKSYANDNTDILDILVSCATIKAAMQYKAAYTSKSELTIVDLLHKAQVKCLKCTRVLYEIVEMT
jgi:hypothetical protein